MSLSDSQLNQLDHDMAINEYEMIVLDIADARALAADVNASSQSSTQLLQVRARTDPNMWGGLRNTFKPLYDTTIHQAVNTNWAIPVGLGAWDAYNINRMLSKIGGLGTKARISTKNGKQYVILTGYPGLRKALKGTRYGIRNAELIDIGIGKYGVRGSSIKGFKLSCYFAVGIEIAEYIFNDKAVLSDLFAGVGVELIKAGIASAIGYAASLALGAVVTTAALPVIIGAVFVLAIGIGLNVLDNKYNIKNSVKSGMRYALENTSELHEKMTKITYHNLKKNSEDVASSIVHGLIDTATDEAKKWILQKLPPSEFPVPSWPKVPNLQNLKLPKF